MSEGSCRQWFRRFKDGDFDLEDRERPGHEKKFEDTELKILLNKDSSQAQEALAEALGVDRSTVSKRLKAMGMVQKQGNWVSCKFDMEKNWVDEWITSKGEEFL